MDMQQPSKEETHQEGLIHIAESIWDKQLEQPISYGTARMSCLEY